MGYFSTRFRRSTGSNKTIFRLGIQEFSVIFCRLKQELQKLQCQLLDFPGSVKPLFLIIGQFCLKSSDGNAEVENFQSQVTFHVGDSISRQKCLSVHTVHNVVDTWSGDQCWRSATSKAQPISRRRQFGWRIDNFQTIGLVMLLEAYQIWWRFVCTSETRKDWMLLANQCFWRFIRNCKVSWNFQWCWHWTTMNWVKMDGLCMVKQQGESARNFKTWNEQMVTEIVVKGHKGAN